MENNPNGRRRLLKAGLQAVGGMAALSAVPAATFASGGGSKAAGSTPVTGTLIRPGGKLPVQMIEDIMQTSGSMMDGVLIVSLDREDLNVMGPDGHPFYPSFGLDHTFTFQSLANGQVFMNAEFTFTQSELQATMAAILSSPLELMGQHQHYIGEQPQTFHYHFRGRGDARTIATAAMSVVQATATPLPQPKNPNPKTPLPSEQIGAILGAKPSVMSDGVVQVLLRRPETFIEAGVVLRPYMNIFHQINFEPLDSSGGKALCGADYALRAGEVSPALQQSNLKEGFEVHCLYNQQTAIWPNLFFSHNLKAGDPIDLAHSVRRVLDVIAWARPYE
jgi:hypothetical protein